MSLSGRRRRAVAVPARGLAGSARGHVWVIAATSAFRCEGLDPWAQEPSYARGHSDIGVGETYLLKRWRVMLIRTEQAAFSSRHCIWCGRAIETARAEGGEGGAG